MGPFSIVSVVHQHGRLITWMQTKNRALLIAPNCAFERPEGFRAPTIVASQGRLFHRAPVAQLVEHRAVTREVAGSNPSRINTQDLKITEEKVLPL